MGHGEIAAVGVRATKADVTHTQFRREYAAVEDGCLGPGVKKASWTANALGVLPEYRRKGVARALLQAGEALVSCMRL